MPAGLLLGYLVAAAMVLVVVIGGIRWARLDRGGRWLVIAVAISVAFLPVSLWMALNNRPNRLLNDVEYLIRIVVMVVAFAVWLPEDRRRRVWWVIPAFVVLWSVAQAIQGLDADFGYVSFPIAGLVAVGVAGYTLVTLVQATAGRWTDNLWFWAATGVMVIYGTAVILDPLWFQLFRVRDDLMLAAFAVNVTGNLIGYVLIARGLWRLPATS
jgi:hypothetical protein